MIDANAHGGAKTRDEAVYEHSTSTTTQLCSGEFHGKMLSVKLVYQAEQKKP